MLTVCFVSFHFLCVGQEAGDDAQERQEGAYPEDELDAGLVGEPAEEGGAQAAQAKHQPEEDAGYQAHLVGHQVGGIDHYGRECRGDDEAGEEGADEGPREVGVRHGKGEGGGAQDGEPYHVFSTELVAKHAACHGADGEGCEEDEEAELRSLYGHAKLVDEEEREVARDARRVEILRENKQDKDEQSPILGSLGDVVVEERLLLRMLHHVCESRLIPSSEPDHDDGSQERRQGEPRDGVLPERQDDDGRKQGTHCRAAIAAHLEDGLRQALLAARCQLCHSRGSGVKDGRSQSHHAHRQENEQIVLGEGEQHQSSQCEAHTHRQCVRSRMLVGIETGEGLQDGRSHLKYQRYDAYLRKREVELILHNRVYGGYDRLDHVVQEMRDAADDEHRIHRALDHRRVALQFVPNSVFDVRIVHVFLFVRCKNTYFCVKLFIFASLI